MSRNEFERRDHAVACVGNRIHIGPFGDDAEGMLAGLDDIGVSKPGPGGHNLVVGVEELLFAPRFLP